MLSEADALQKELAPYVPRVVRRWPGGDRSWCRVEGTLVSADISGFTKLSEKLATLGKEGAEELTDLINECFDGMIAIAGAVGGDVLKFGGDALLLLFRGAGHAERACEAAVGMRTSIARPLRTRTVRKVTLRMSQGIHSGEFDLHLVEGAHHELMVVGPGVTATVDCEATAEAGEILLSESAAAAVPPRWLGRAKDGGRLLSRVESAPPYVRLVGDQAHVDLTRYVAAAQQEQIEAGATGEHRRVTVGFVKFSGIDELIERTGPEEVSARLQRLGGAVREAEEAYGVHWLASDVYPDGGKVILTAGAPVSYGDDEERAIRGLRQILDADTGLSLRAGVNAGHVFVGNLGARSRRTFTVMGDAVNLAARLMQKAGAGELIATVDLLDHTTATFATRRLDPFLVKGKAKPIEAAAVSGLAAGEDDAGTTHADATAGVPLIGRDDELETLVGAIDAAGGGHGRVVEIVADAGMGKSSLVAAVRAARPAVPVLVAAGGRYAQGTPYFAVRSLVRDIVGIPADADRDAAGEQLMARVVEDAPALAPWLPLVAIVSDAAVPDTTEVDSLAPEFRRSRLNEVVVDLLAALIRRPTMLLVEDAHWLDDASLALLRQLCWRAADEPWTVITTRRPGADPVADAAPHVTPLPLPPLDADSARELARASAATDLLPGDIERIVDRGGGLPMFVAELARSASAGAGDGVLPDSVESVVTVRIDSLRPAHRLLLREASVLGAVVDVDLLSEALGPAAGVPATWRALEAFLERTGRHRLRFRHALYHEVAYEGLSFRRRREVHELVGQAIERRTGDRSEEMAPLLSLHFHRAGSHGKAWRYSVLAGDHARATYANVEAAEFYRRAIDSAGRIADVGDTEVREVWEALGDVSELGARYDAATSAYAAARRLGPPEADLVRLLRKEGVVRERQGRYTQALRWYGRGLRLVGSLSGGERPRAEMDLAIGYAATRYRQGRFAECARWAERAVAAAEAAGELRGVAHASYLMENALTSLGRPEAERWRDRALPIFEELGDLVGQGNALNNLGCTAYYEGRWDEALACFRRSRDARERSGDVMGSATEISNVGEVLSDQGRLDEAVPLVEEALRTWRAARYPVGVAQATINLARAKARLGLFEEAEVLLGEARRQFEALGASAYLVETEVRQVELLVLAGRHDDALVVGSALEQRLRAGAGEDIVLAALLRLLGFALLRRGRVEESRAYFGESLARGEAIEARYEMALTLLGVAESAESDAQASDAGERARRLLDDLGVVRVPEIP